MRFADGGVGAGFNPQFAVSTASLVAAGERIRCVAGLAGTDGERGGASGLSSPPERRDSQQHGQAKRIGVSFRGLNKVQAVALLHASGAHPVAQSSSRRRHRMSTAPRPTALAQPAPKAAGNLPLQTRAAESRDKSAMRDRNPLPTDDRNAGPANNSIPNVWIPSHARKRGVSALPAEKANGETRAPVFHEDSPEGAGLDDPVVRLQLLRFRVSAWGYPPAVFGRRVGWSWPSPKTAPLPM